MFRTTPASTGPLSARTPTLPHISSLPLAAPHRSCREPPNVPTRLTLAYSLTATASTIVSARITPRDIRVANERLAGRDPPRRYSRPGHDRQCPSSQMGWL